MDARDVAGWMLAQVEEDGCVYQDDVVDHVVRANSEELLRENSDGNLVLGITVLNAFKKLTPESVVWVRPDRYWRWRVAEDEPGRDARG
ncbi:DUF6953 family protein [Pseudomonas sp. P9_31]|uniref:DUF6953 family protein n=1 Tax=Pseudomonas sp. P9_31 TaxID=3043448 RepID=UPI002A3594AE|nr:hypothetical protein [Pseudomonas sp. P9_31]WPN59741.1 hypothetical protein QMK51_09105 [Pseudomonas sp. P9_31]